ncbi:MAG: hypothetical protein SGBAC_009270 [Bacillariaceae sp.]
MQTWRTCEESEEQPCPCCNTATTGLYLNPLPFDDLEDAVRLRKAAALNKNKGKSYCDTDADIEARYLVYSQGRNTVSSTLSDTDNARTGRWTEEEVAFVDHLVQTFDKGAILLPQGTKLATFLCDMLLCKATRLTKKMKNAQLSTRAFKITQTPLSIPTKEDCQVLSALQDRFISSMPTKVAQLELKFNLVKQWRTFFSDLCVQIGFQGLDAHDWISSVEEIENRASKAEEQMRIVRRKRMGLGGRSSQQQPPLKQARSEPMLQNIATNSSSVSASGMNAGSAWSSDPNLSIYRRIFSADVDNAIMSLDHQDGESSHSLFDEETSTVTVPRSLSSSNDPFLEAISRFMEKRETPFQHADVWVPSSTSGSGEAVQLLHAGHATRRDLGKILLDTLKNFGEISRAFTFHPNIGLPGRVYAAGKAQWEFELSNPTFFFFLFGAQAYGLQTAVGMPINTPGVGRIVVVFYSSSRLMEDQSFVSRCASELASYAPRPKWKLQIEIGNPRLGALSQGSAATSGISAPEKGSEPAVVDKIVSLLGNELASASDANPSPQDMSLQVMRMRLALLKKPSSRSAREDEVVGILEGSYKAYAEDNKRSESELARLLVAEYMCLCPMDAANAVLLGSSSEPQPDEVSQQPLLPLQNEGTAMPKEVYSSTQLEIPGATLPPLPPPGVPRAPTRPQSVVSHSSMYRSEAISDTTALAPGNFAVSGTELNEQPPSF